MIARRSALLMLAAAIMATPALAKTDWTNTVAATPQGGILIGNPAARIKLVEFASYSCSHCATFHKEGLPALKAKYIATGDVSLEQRSFVRNGPDFAASLLVACLPARAGLDLAGKFFAEQEAWLAPFVAMTRSRQPGDCGAAGRKGAGRAGTADRAGQMGQHARCAAGAQPGLPCRQGGAGQVAGHSPGCDHDLQAGRHAGLWHQWRAGAGRFRLG